MKSPSILLSLVAAVAMTFGLSTSTVQGQGSCGGDNNGDGLVNGVDLAIVLGTWGVCPGVITSVTPLQGSILGGTQITINGTNLAGTTAVKIGGVACTNLQVLSPTLVKAVTPAGSAGEVPISVITPAVTLLAPTPFVQTPPQVVGAVQGWTAQTQDIYQRWVSTWTASPQYLEWGLYPDPVPSSFWNQTLRQVVRTSIGGSKLRIRLSNEYGNTPLYIGSVSVARHAEGATVVAGSSRNLTFSGRTSFTIPAGAPALSDPIDFDVPALGDLAVSVYLPEFTTGGTLHALGNTTYISPWGDYSQAEVMPTTTSVASWFFLSAVTTQGGKHSAAVVAIGDSITDGVGSTIDTNTNRRWPSLLAARLQANPIYSQVAVLNQGISGNRTQFDLIGPNSQARFDRDVLNAVGARWVVLLQGINNIGIPGAYWWLLGGEHVSAADIIAGHQQLIERAHERGLRIYGGTLTPFEGTTLFGFFSADGEAKRQAVNLWIRKSGAFDAVIDFDEVLRDPAHPARMLPVYDSGDHLHPSDAGYQAMADAIDLSMFDY